MIVYRVDVRPMLDEIGGSIAIEDTVDLEPLIVCDERFEPISPASVSVTVTNAGGGIVATGTIDAPMHATCARCLCEFDLVITGEVEGFYVQAHQERGEEGDTEEVDEDGAIDLGPALVAALVVEAPFAPVHADDCAGLCAQCGVDLNTEQCACSDVASEEHPFAPLKGIAIDGENE